MMMYGETKDKK